MTDINTAIISTHTHTHQHRIINTLQIRIHLHMEQMLNHKHTSIPHTPTYGTDVYLTLIHKQDSTHDIIDSKTNTRTGM